MPKAASHKMQFSGVFEWCDQNYLQPFSYIWNASPKIIETTGDPSGGLGVWRRVFDIKRVLVGIWIIMHQILIICLDVIKLHGKEN